MTDTKTDTAGRDLASETVFMVQHGLLDGWVCAPKSMDMEAVQTAVHRDVFPAGTTNGWIVETAADEDEPRRNSPGLCAEDDSRQHWHVVC
jgi:hypothetical protein